MALLCALSVPGLAAPAGASEKDKATEGAAKKAPAPGRIHVQVYAAKGLTESERVILEEAVETGLRSAGAKQVVTGYPKMKRKGGRAAANKALARSDRAFVEAKKRVRKLEMDGALDLLDWAALEYAKYLPYLIARDSNADRLAAVYVQTAIVQFLDGKKDEAKKAIRQAFVLKPKLDYNAKTFPPQMRSFVDEERLLFDESGKGSLRISLKGGPARVYVNGIDRGKAPVVVHELRNGPNLVVFSAPGVEPVSMVAEVVGGDVKEVSGELTIPPAKVTGPMARTRGDVSMPVASKQLQKAARALDVKGMVLVVPTVEEDYFGLGLFVYDMRSNKLVGQRTIKVERTKPRPPTEAAAGKLYREAAWQLELRIAPKRESGPSLWTRMGRRWDRVRHHKYFWPAVGTAAGIVAVGIIIKVAAGGGLSNGQKVGLFPITRF
jgi:hypothetical protein